MKYQSGMSFTGVVLIIAGIACFALLAFKLTPPYLANMKIQSALEETADAAATSGMSPREFIKALEQRLYVDYAHQEIDYAQDITFDKTETGVSVVIDYEKVVPIVYNISALMEFNNSVDIDN